MKLPVPSGRAALNGIGLVTLGALGLASVLHGVPQSASGPLFVITGGIIGCINGTSSKPAKNPQQGDTP
ncbi:MAG: hypothetical protein ACREEH_03745 [Caulobacteraceae bacterium]